MLLLLLPSEHVFEHSVDRGLVVHISDEGFRKGLVLYANLHLLLQALNLHAFSPVNFKLRDLRILQQYIPHDLVVG